MIFKDENDRLAAITHLATLKDHPAWVYFERALTENVEHLTNELRTKKGFDSVEQFEAIQDRIADIEETLRLPVTLIEDAKNNLPEQEDDPDPFGSIEPPKP